MWTVTKTEHGQVVKRQECSSHEIAWPLAEKWLVEATGEIPAAEADAFLDQLSDNNSVEYAPGLTIAFAEHSTNQHHV